MKGHSDRGIDHVTRVARLSFFLAIAIAVGNAATLRSLGGLSILVVPSLVEAASPGPATVAPLIKTAPPLGPVAGTVIHVKTEPELQTALRHLRSDTTILVAPGTYKLTNTLQIVGVRNVALRGATDGRDDVVLVGPGMSNSRYGYVPHGVYTQDSSNILIANLTIRDVYFHPIVFNPGTQSPRVYNVHLINAGEQFIKANPKEGKGVDNGIVEYSMLEYLTTARGTYTNGVDVIAGRSWIIRNNVFKNQRAPGSRPSGPVILMWGGSKNTITEGNLFLNCQYGIAYGLTNRIEDHRGGVIRNNFFHRSSGQSGDVGIVVNSSPGTKVLHNTVILSGTYPNAIEYRFPTTTNVIIRCNLADAVVQRRDGASGTVSDNVTNAKASWFVDLDQGDLHLTREASPAIDGVSWLEDARADYDGQIRPLGKAADVGADEFGNAQGR